MAIDQETYEHRLAALDRAIEWLAGNPEASPETVIDLARKFEDYLDRSD